MKLQQPQMIGVVMPIERIRSMLTSTPREVIVRTTEDAVVTAHCKACNHAVETAWGGPMLWFHCPCCHQLSVAPRPNVLRDAAFAKEDRAPFQYEVFYMRDLPSELLSQSPFEVAVQKALSKPILPPITCYGIDQSCKTVELGIVGKEEAIQIVSKFSAMQVGLQGSANEVLAKSLFGFSIDKKRFIEIAMETDTKFRVKLEMPGRLWGIYQKEITIEGLSKLHKIVEHFFTIPLCEFKRYFQAVR